MINSHSSPSGPLDAESLAAHFAFTRQAYRLEDAASQFRTAPAADPAWIVQQLD